MMSAAALRVVVTGASSGLGLALARHYLEQGAVVGVYARRAELLQTLAEQHPGRVHLYPLDVRDTAAQQAAAADFISHVGAPDIVIANAGVSVGTLTEYAEDLDAFQQVMDINVLGMVKTFQPYLATMRSLLPSPSGAAPRPPDGRASGGALLASGGVGGPRTPPTFVGIASVAGFRGLPGASAYSASKAAAISYLESLRVELLGSGVRVVTICPGYIRTPMTDVNPYPMPFMLEADEAARRMARAIAAGKSFTVLPWQMGLGGRLLRWLPNWLFDRLFAKAQHKPRGLLG
ncbi:MAG: SDR family oxidoreductase [Nitrosomonadales bacterium]|nr:SDR family oxidoreductase [Nitrosomonadales bacterium]